MAFTIKEIAEHFWEQAMAYASEKEFGSPKNAKTFDTCWETFKSYEPKIEIVEMNPKIITPRLD